MMGQKWYAVGRWGILGLCLTVLSGCATGSAGGGSGQANDGTGTGDPDGGGEQTGELTVNFDDAGGGSFAVAQDDEGNQYSFKDNNGKLIEANIQFASDGTTVKVSLDSAGRPVKIRASNNENADLTFESDDTSRVRYTSADSVVEDVAGLAITSAKSRVQARRLAFEEKQDPRLQANDRINMLKDGLATLEEIIESLLDDPDNPLSGTRLAEAVSLIGRIASSVDFKEVGRDELPDVVLDTIPDAIAALAGNTYILFEAEGHCVEEAGLANRLTFDQFGVLLTEFDINFVFPDFSVGGANPGVTVNYAAGTTFDLTPGDDAGFRATVTPVFTGTQLDEDGRITIERRFAAEIEYEVELFTVSSALTEQVFNAALVDGSLDGDVLEFTLILLDLALDEPVFEPIRARYYRQGSQTPENRLFACERHTGEDGSGSLKCPSDVETYRAFEISLDTRERDDFAYDWFVSAGYGYVENPFAANPTVVPTHPGFMEVTLVVSRFTTDEELFDVYTCELQVGELTLSEGFIDCPTEALILGEPHFFYLGFDEAEALQDLPADGSTDSYGTDGRFDVHTLDIEWFVKGTGNVDVYRPFDFETEVTFYEPGRFEVWAVKYTEFGEEYFSCEVEVVGRGGQDLCAEFGYYSDGICDDFCAEPDPDCALDFDWCAEQGWYGDGICDDCPEPDPDCEFQFDYCEEAGLYGDGYCDRDCPYPDPDCELDGYRDECAELGYYSDGICDDYCLEPDPDCEDYCALNGLYGDGYCDECPNPDPDCDDVGTNGIDGTGIDSTGIDGTEPDGTGSTGGV